MSNSPRIPLHMQNTEIAKAAKQSNPSYESFRPNEIHESKYQDMGDRPSTHAMARMRRGPDGVLDLQWATNVILDAIHKAEYNGYLTPLEESLLTVVFPVKFRMTEPQMAEIRTQLSRTEKAKLKQLVSAHISEEANYNAGRGGGSTPGRTRTLNGVG